MKILIDIILYLLSAVFSVVGMILLRMALADQSIESLIASPQALAILAIGMCGYLGGIAVWLLVMVRNPLGIAYPIGTGVVMVASVVAGQVFLAEMIRIEQWIGVMTIMLGIILLSTCGNGSPSRPRT